MNCDNETTVFTPRRLAPLVLAAILSSVGCHAQTPVAPKVENGAPLSPALTYRVEILLRNKAQLPPGSLIHISPVQPASLPGYHTISATFSADDKTSHPVDFLISDDGKTIAQFIKYDISPEPRTMIADDGRPSRGGPPTAPVVIVNFDDLECPFCARFHESIFPAITQRYGDKVHIVYKDFPLTEIHPWAMHAAVDVNCLAAQSIPGYWNLVDSMHARAGAIGTDPNAKPEDAKSGAPQHTLDRATAQLDKLTRDEGVAQHADAAKLDACITKQDTAAVEANRLAGNTLDIGSTPTYFINGEKFDGALPIEYVFARIDDALRAEGLTPPPPYAAPAPATSPAAAASNPSVAKPSSAQ
jgi:protein-disulfide isomerase